jgi:Fe-S-cluster containining protein
MVVSLDCTRCGACCVNTEQNRREGYLDYVEIGLHDLLRKKPELMRRYAVENETGQKHMRLDVHQRCGALRGAPGRRVRCDIYEVRPAACRKVEPGSRACLLARAEKGIPG